MLQHASSLAHNKGDSGPLVSGSLGPLVSGSLGPLVSGPQVLWSPGPWVLRVLGAFGLWSSGPLVSRSLGPLVLGSFGLRSLGPLFSGPQVFWSPVLGSLVQCSQSPLLQIFSDYYICKIIAVIAYFLIRCDPFTDV